jgi:hypothetical protein
MQAAGQPGRAERLRQRVAALGDVRLLPVMTRMARAQRADCGHDRQD